MPADATTSRLLESDAFLRCRHDAERVAGDPEAIRRLLAEVAEKIDGDPLLRCEPTAVNIDIAAAMLESHLDDLDGDPTRMQTMAPILLTRIRYVIAGLVYLVQTRDVIPDDHENGLVDDLTVLRWVVHVASGGEGTEYQV